MRTQIKVVLAHVLQRLFFDLEHVAGVDELQAVVPQRRHLETTRHVLVAIADARGGALRREEAGSTC